MLPVQIDSTSAADLLNTLGLSSQPIIGSISGEGCFLTNDPNLNQLPSTSGSDAEMLDSALPELRSFFGVEEEKRWDYEFDGSARGCSLVRA